MLHPNPDRRPQSISELLSNFEFMSSQPLDLSDNEARTQTKALINHYVAGRK